MAELRIDGPGHERNRRRFHEGSNILRADGLGPGQMKSFSKGGGDPLPDGVHVGNGPQERRHGGDTAVGNPARDDMRKRCQIHGDVQRKTMRGDALGNPHPNKCDFRWTAAPDPHPRQALLAMADNSPLGQGCDENLFQPMDVRFGPCAVVEGSGIRSPDPVRDR